MAPSAEGFKYLGEFESIFETALHHQSNDGILKLSAGLSRDISDFPQNILWKGMPFLSIFCIKVFFLSADYSVESFSIFFLNLAEIFIKKRKLSEV